MHLFQSISVLPSMLRHDVVPHWWPASLNMTCLHTIITVKESGDNAGFTVHVNVMLSICFCCLNLVSCLQWANLSQRAGSGGRHGRLAEEPRLLGTGTRCWTGPLLYQRWWHQCLLPARGAQLPWSWGELCPLNKIKPDFLNHRCNQLINAWNTSVHPLKQILNLLFLFKPFGK